VLFPRRYEIKVSHLFSFLILHANDQ
jgi:hypothetical protein